MCKGSDGTECATRVSRSTSAREFFFLSRKLSRCEFAESSRSLTALFFAVVVFRGVTCDHPFTHTTTHTHPCWPPRLAAPRPLFPRPPAWHAARASATARRCARRAQRPMAATRPRPLPRRPRRQKTWRRRRPASQPWSKAPAVVSCFFLGKRRGRVSFFFVAFFARPSHPRHPSLSLSTQTHRLRRPAVALLHPVPQSLHHHHLPAGRVEGRRPLTRRF